MRPFRRRCYSCRRCGHRKDKTLIRKIATIIENGISSPYPCIDSTKAAEKSAPGQEDIGDRLGLVAGTFHSFCLTVLRAFKLINPFRVSSFLRNGRGRKKRMMVKYFRQRIGDFLGIPLDVVERLMTIVHARVKHV